MEGAFGTTEQKIQKISSYDDMSSLLLVPIASRMSHQEERVESISGRVVCLIEQSDVDALLTLLQAERISINYLSCHSIGQESLKILADALKEKGKSSCK